MLLAILLTPIFCQQYFKQGWEFHENFEKVIKPLQSVLPMKNYVDL